MSSAGAPNRVIITLGILMATVMSALDTTVVNVALPHMQGSLSASPEQITWVLTSYIVATAVTTPVSGWLSARIGIKALMMCCVAGFTTTSVLCGLASNLPQLVIFRIMQGMMAAPMLPLAQAVLLNINPPERFGRAMAVFTMASVVAPAVGPVVGGFLTEDYTWRWCFYINVPAGIGSMVLLWIFLPKGVVQKRQFDALGFASLAVAVGACQLMLDRGTVQDWFSSNEICIEAVVAGAAFWVYVIHTITARNPLFPPAIGRDRNFVTTMIFGFLTTALAFCSLALLPLMMQGVLGYPVIYSGMLSMPRGLVMLVILQIMGRLDAIVNRRLLIAVGLTFLTFAFWQMTHFDLNMSGNDMIWATVLQGVGQGILFVPLTTAGFATIAPELRPDASAALNLVRNFGGSLGVAAIQALTAINTQTMHASLAAHIRPSNPLLQAVPHYLSPETAQALNAEITRQATMVAYIDDFRVMAVVALLCAPLIFILRQPRRQSPATATPEAAGHP